MCCLCYQRIIRINHLINKTVMESGIAQGFCTHIPARVSLSSEYQNERTRPYYTLPDRNDFRDNNLIVLNSLQGKSNE